MLRRLHNFDKGSKGFTLIELLVVMSIIGLLASITLVSMNGARKKARIARRLSDMRQVQTALELYYASNNSYPTTGGNWFGQCAYWGGYSANNVIPGLAPTYMATVPSDPSMNAPANQNCYLYKSDGTTGYKFMDYWAVDMTQQEMSQYPQYLDGIYSNSGVCGPTSFNYAWSVYSDNWACTG